MREARHTSFPYLDKFKNLLLISIKLLRVFLVFNKIILKTNSMLTYFVISESSFFHTFTLV